MAEHYSCKYHQVSGDPLKHIHQYWAIYLPNNMSHVVLMIYYSNRWMRLGNKLLLNMHQSVLWKAWRSCRLYLLPTFTETVHMQQKIEESYLHSVQQDLNVQYIFLKDCVIQHYFVSHLSIAWWWLQISETCLVKVQTSATSFTFRLSLDRNQLLFNHA